MPKDIPDHLSRPAPRSRTGGGSSQSTRKPGARPEDERNLVGKLKSLSVRGDERPINKTSPSGNRPFKKQFSANASPLTTSTRLQDSAYISAAQYQSSVGHEEGKVEIATWSSTPSAGHSSRTQNPSTGATTSRAGRGNKKDRSSRYKDTSEESAGAVEKKDEGGNLQATETFTLAIVVRSPPPFRSVSSWSFILDTGNYRRALFMTVIGTTGNWVLTQGLAFTESDNQQIVAGQRLAQYSLQDYETCRQCIMATGIDQMARPGYSERWCFNVLRDLNHLRLIAVDLLALHQDLVETKTASMRRLRGEDAE